MRIPAVKQPRYILLLLLLTVPELAQYRHQLAWNMKSVA